MLQFCARQKALSVVANGHDTGPARTGIGLDFDRLRFDAADRSGTKLGQHAKVMATAGGKCNAEIGGG
jgi:hypothetical protein